MKKFLISILFMFLAMPVFSEPIENATSQIDDLAKPIEIGVTFDWISKNQIQRDENIAQIQSTLFNYNTVSKYSKKEFKEKNAPFWKNKNYLKDYDEISSGKKEDADKYYCGFFWGKLLMAYGIQYKNNMKNIYYYDAMGHLKFLDYYSDKYPNFPYMSYQYDTSGRMVAAYYYVSDYDQYVFDPNKKFKGRWYKENMYNKNAKIIMTRTNY